MLSAHDATMTSNSQAHLGQALDSSPQAEVDHGDIAEATVNTDLSIARILIAAESSNCAPPPCSCPNCYRQLQESSALFYQAARRRTMYGRLREQASSLLETLRLKPAADKSPVPTPLPPPNLPYDRILDMSRLLRGRTASPCDQTQSPFFTRLPPEIRTEIYSLILPPHKHIWIRPSPHQKQLKPATGGSLWIEHFPWAGAEPPTDLSFDQYTYYPGAVCPARRRVANFFGFVEAEGLEPHGDALALMKCCQRMYAPQTLRH